MRWSVAAFVLPVLLASCERKPRADDHYSLDAIFRRAAEREKDTRRRVARLPRCVLPPVGDTTGWTRPTGSWHALPPEVSGVVPETLLFHGGLDYRSPDGRYLLRSLGRDDLEEILLDYRAQGPGLACQLEMPDGLLALFVRQDTPSGSRALVWPVRITTSSGGTWSLSFSGPDSSVGSQLLRTIATHRQPASDSGQARKGR